MRVVVVLATPSFSHGPAHGSCGPRPSCGSLGYEIEPEPMTDARRPRALAALLHDSCPSICLDLSGNRVLSTDNKSTA